jgi:glucose/mannose transport system substrate-binding protein
MTQFVKRLLGATALAACLGGPAMATDLEVTHWWTSGGEAAAVAEFAKAFDATGNKWIDGAIAGSTDVAVPIIIGRIKGGNPMAATQLNTGRDTEELIKAGLMLDLTDLANKEGWKDAINARPYASCQVDGRVYCLPVNIHSTRWMWLNKKVFEDNGIAVPKNWNDLVAAAPKLREKGILPLSLAGGWPINILLNNIALANAGMDGYLKVFRDKDVAAAGGPEWKKVFEGMDQARNLIQESEMSPTGEWAGAVNLVITGKAAANVMGDWAQGEFAVAGQVAGKDYECLPGLGVAEVVDIGGDSFFFPKNNDPKITEAQLQLASVLISKETQVAFNLKKGSMPSRGDVDLNAANDCMKKGLAILADDSKVLPSNEQLLSSDTQQQITDLYNEFFSDKKMTVDAAQAAFVEIIKTAD